MCIALNFTVHDPLCTRHYVIYLLSTACIYKIMLYAGRYLQNLVSSSLNLYNTHSVIAFISHGVYLDCTSYLIIDLLIHCIAIIIME